MKKKNFDTIIITIIVAFLILIRFFLQTDKIESFSLIFISILFEALPFILLGSIISSIISVFVSSETLHRIIPNNKYLGVLIMSFTGLIFPLCECSIVPITKKLIDKKLPKSMAIAFMLSVPVANPIVFMSTYYAFQSFYIPILRMLIGIFSGFIIAITLEALTKKEPITSNLSTHQSNCLCKNPLHEHNHDTVHEHSHENQSCQHSHHKCDSKLMLILEHSVGEFFSMGKYLIFGAFISALLQTVVPSQSLLKYGQNSFFSVLAMMLLAFTLSVCSEADAFVAKSFTNLFKNGSLLSFLTFGPMLDIKNTIMIFGSFGRKFALKLIIIISLYHLLLGFILNLIGV